jgi:hypothetical protein
MPRSGTLLAANVNVASMLLATGAPLTECDTCAWRKEADMSDKSLGNKVAGVVVGIVTAVTGATQGSEVKEYVQTERAAESSHQEQISRDVDTEARTSSDKSGQSR